MRMGWVIDVDENGDEDEDEDGDEEVNENEYVWSRWSGTCRTSLENRFGMHNLRSV